MDSIAVESVLIRAQDDIVKIRQVVRAKAAAIGLSLVDQTKIVTAASELARNALEYGGGGRMHSQIIDELGRRGLRLTFEDFGPGIADVEQAMRDGFTSGGGLGLGLGGAKRLSNEFKIETAPGKGTRVTIARWK
jgi:serine/threonine-protein kinase RsbT